jgi:hypothetical protein
MNRWMIYSTCSIFAFCAVGTAAASSLTVDLDAMPPTDAADLGDDLMDDAIAAASPRPTPA